MCKMKYLILVFLFSLGGEHYLAAQEITFLDGKYDTALKQAKNEGKPVFIDFYATWCGPCKELAQTVFVDPEIKAYYDGHFVCVRIDIDKEQKLAEKYGITSIPTLVYLDSKGKEVKRLTGMTEKTHFLHVGQEVRGERPALPELFKQYQNNQMDLNILKTMLLEAPRYVDETPNVEGERWKNRMMGLFPKYVGMKGLARMINEDDFQLFMLYGTDVHPGDTILNFLNAHYKEYESVVEPQIVWQYIISKQSALINRLARAGDSAYREELNRVNGDMKDVFSKIPNLKLPVYDVLKNEADAQYALYAEKNEGKFMELKESYFTQVGDLLSFRDYQEAIGGLVGARQGKLEPASYERCLVWLDRASHLKLNAEEQMNLYCLMGNCFNGLKQIDNAKACFNQAYVLAMQINDGRMQAQIKAMLERLAME